MKNKTRIFAFTLVIISTCFAYKAECQISSTKEYYLTNKQSNKVLDVRGGSMMPGTQIWQYNRNFTEAQTFRIVLYSNYGNEAYKILPQVGSNLYLSLKFKDFYVSDIPSSPSMIVSAPPTEFKEDNSSRIVTNADNYNIIQDKQYNISPNHQPTSPQFSQPIHQIWKFIPVQNEPNTYIIQSAAFSDRMVLQPIDNNSQSELKISVYTGSNIQKWIISTTVPEKVTELALSDFTWKASLFSGKISGTLNWKDNSTNEDKFEIYVRRKGANGYYSDKWSLGQISANKTTFNFQDGSKHGQYKRHCFLVKASNNWGSTLSDEVCEIPSSYTPPPPPPPPPPTGISSIAAYNCHSQQKPVRWWTYDITTDSGYWVDRGQQTSQWPTSGSGSCPDGSPLLIPLTDGHSFIVKAIDCGNNPPNTTNSSCLKLTTTQAIPGKSGGSVLVLTIQ